MSLIHPTAQISTAARLAPDVSVGPFTVIEGPVELAAGVKIGGHAYLTGRTTVGEGTSIGWGAVIGADPQDLSFDPATESGVAIGPRNSIREYVTIHRGSKPGALTTLGRENLLMTGVHLAHDVVLGDLNVLANNVLLGGHVRVANRAFLGGAAAFHQFIRIGDLAMVQGLSAVSQDIPPYCMAYGINRLAGLNLVGLRRAGLTPADRDALKRLYKLLFLSSLTRDAALAAAAETEWPPAARTLIDAVASPSKKGVATP